jgi:hypothetical protein
MEFCRGRGNCWFLLGVCAYLDVDDKAFSLKMACKLIGHTAQQGGVQVVHENKKAGLGFSGGQALFPT